MYIKTEFQLKWHQHTIGKQMNARGFLQIFPKDIGCLLKASNDGVWRVCAWVRASANRATKRSLTSQVCFAHKRQFPTPLYDELNRLTLFGWFAFVDSWTHLIGSLFISSSYCYCWRASIIHKIAPTERKMRHNKASQRKGRDSEWERGTEREQEG